MCQALSLQGILNHTPEGIHNLVGEKNRSLECDVLSAETEISTCI